jgi:acetylornithine deacetylase/succinyl-diaminopimelate desuccinylase-like protein
VRELKPEEREQWKRLPFNERRYAKEIGAPKLYGERGYTTLERVWARPTLEVNGLLGGFTGEGAKTVIPAVAMAKVSMRLVPDQDPDKIAQLFEDYVKKIAPKTVEVKVTRMHGGKPWMTDFDNRFVQAAGRAIEKGFG